MNHIIIGQVYRCIDGDFYRVLHLARDIVRREILVVYQSLKDPNLVCAEPYESFTGHTPAGLFPNGKDEDRFVLVDTDDLPAEYRQPPAPKTTITWQGEEDMREIINSGILDDEIEGLDDEQIEMAVQKAADQVNWTCLRDASIKLGHDMILQVLSETLREVAENKPFDLTIERTQRIQQTIYAPDEETALQMVDEVIDHLPDDSFNKGDRSLDYSLKDAQDRTILDWN